MLNLKNRFYFLMNTEAVDGGGGEEDDSNKPTIIPANAGTSLADLVTDDAAKEFVNKSTYDANAIVKLAMEGQRLSTPIANFNIGRVSDTLHKTHGMDADSIRGFLNDDKFVKEVLQTAKDTKASQEVGEGYLVKTILDLHQTEKGENEKFDNSVVNAFGTKEAYDTTANKFNTKMEVYPQSERVDAAKLTPAALKSIMGLLDSGSFNANALPGQSVIIKADNTFEGRDGTGYMVNADGDIKSLNSQLNEIPAGDKRNNPKWEKFLADIVHYRKQNELPV